MSKPYKVTITVEGEGCVRTEEEGEKTEGMEEAMRAASSAVAKAPVTRSFFRWWQARPWPIRMLFYLVILPILLYGVHLFFGWLENSKWAIWYGENVPEEARQIEEDPIREYVGQVVGDMESWPRAMISPPREVPVEPPPKVTPKVPVEVPAKATPKAETIQPQAETTPPPGESITPAPGMVEPPGETMVGPPVPEDTVDVVPLLIVGEEIAPEEEPEPGIVKKVVDEVLSLPVLSLGGGEGDWVRHHGHRVRTDARMPRVMMPGTSSYRSCVQGCMELPAEEFEECMEGCAGIR